MDLALSLLNFAILTSMKGEEIQKPNDINTVC